MTNSRLESFRAMVARTPDNPLAHYGLANEALKAEQWAEALTHYEAYLARSDDEGNAYGKVAQALERLGRVDEARDMLRRGIAASYRFGHGGMAAELEEQLEALA